LPAPGFSTVAFTVIDSVSILGTKLSAAPAYLATASGTVGYELSIDNSGTGPAVMQQILVTLPVGFSYSAGSAMLDATSLPDPVISGRVLTFAVGLGSVAPGASVKLTLEAAVTGAAQDGVNTVSIDVWFTDPLKGETVNDSRAGLGEVLVGVPRSATPVITGKLLAGDTKVAGTTSEATGTTVRVYANGVEAAQTVSVAGGKWTVTLAPLFGGQRLSATAKASGELESVRSAEVSVLSTSGITACSDGKDNDGDGKTDFPADVDCASAADPDETRTPQCADAADNDGDGKIDFGADLGCSSLLDDSEKGAAQCADGKDNDGDGDIDYPDDRGCSGAKDVSETDLPACADGKDNDGDGHMDFPDDSDCVSAADDQEAALAATLDAGASAPDGGSVDSSVGEVDGSAGGPQGARGDASDLGGVSAPSNGGCGCAIAGSPKPHRLASLLGVLLLGVLLRRARKPARSRVPR